MYYEDFSFSSPTNNTITCGFRPKKIFASYTFNNLRINIYYDADVSTTQFKQYNSTSNVGMQNIGTDGQINEITNTGVKLYQGGVACTNLCCVIEG